MRPSENRLLALPIPWKREAEGWTPTATEASGVMKQSSGQPDLLVCRRWQRQPVERGRGSRGLKSPLKPKESAHLSPPPQPVVTATRCASQPAGECQPKALQLKRQSPKAEARGTKPLQQSERARSLLQQAGEGRLPEELLIATNGIVFILRAQGGAKAGPRGGLNCSTQAKSRKLGSPDPHLVSTPSSQWYHPGAVARKGCPAGWWLTLTRQTHLTK